LGGSSITGVLCVTTCKSGRVTLLFLSGTDMWVCSLSSFVQKWILSSPESGHFGLYSDSGLYQEGFHDIGCAACIGCHKVVTNCNKNFNKGYIFPCATYFPSHNGSNKGDMYTVCVVF